MSGPKVAVSWFNEEDWPRWLAIDPDFEPDYQRWLAKTEDAIRQRLAAGYDIQKAVLDPDQFLGWSRLNRAGQVDSHARAAYAVALLSLQHRSGPRH